MEQWQISVINKCAKEGNLPKGFPFNKAQVGSLLNINPAEFILLSKEGFIHPAAEGSDNFNTTERWDNLKLAGSYDALMVLEGKSLPAASAKPVVAETAPTKTAAVQPIAAQPSVAATEEKKPAPATPKAEVKPAQPHAAPAPKKPEASPKPSQQTVPSTPVPQMDLVALIGIAGAVLGALVIIFSVLKK